MRWLNPARSTKSTNSTNSRNTKRHIKDDRGSTAVILAVSMSAIFGIGAVVVDMGTLLQERRVLQNGADAGALAVAEQCGVGACGDALTTAATYADANADDDNTSVEEICGSGVDGVSACAVAPTSVPAGASYVQVTTITDDGAGGDEVPFGFARIFGLDGMSVRARAVAAWGGPSALVSALPVTISQCEYNAYTSSGTDLEDPPPYTSGYPTPEAVIYLHDTTGASPCPSGGSGADLPGGFGWLETTTGCEAISSIDDWFDDSTGRPPPTSCTATLMAALVGTVVALPIFDQTNGLTGTNGEYHMSGYAAFYVTGYSIVGQYKVQSLVTGSYPCSGQASCISGFFVNAPAPVSGSIGGPSMGVTVVALVE